MKKLLVLICAACFCLLPVVALAGNATPHLYLEIWSFSTKQTTLPGYICVHSEPSPAPAIHCWSDVIGTHVYVAVHIGKLGPAIICPDPPGPLCENYAGYLGMPWGIQENSDVALTFNSLNACPGFLKGPSIAGEPVACLVSSLQLCHDWRDHLAYLYYRNIDGTSVADLTIVKSGDTPELPGPLVINCSNTYDFGTVVGGGARLGGTVLSCSGDPTAVELQTWGQIKGLYR